jgi:hypothetical protein
LLPLGQTNSLACFYYGQKPSHKSADDNALSKPKSFVPLFEILSKAALNLRRLALDRYLPLLGDNSKE